MGLLLAALNISLETESGQIYGSVIEAAAGLCVSSTVFWRGSLLLLLTSGERLRAFVGSFVAS